MSTPDIAVLEQARNDARVQVAKHANQDQVVGISKRIVELKAKPSKTTAEKQELEDLIGERDRLQTEQHAPLAKAQFELTAARRASRAVAELAEADEFRSMSIAELESLREQQAIELKAAKRKRRAVSIALSEKLEEQALEEQLARLTPAQKTALKSRLS